jgi:hypothetical protein
VRRRFCFGVLLFAASHLLAQNSFVVEGYITSAHLPGSFKTGGRTVVLTRHTAFGVSGLESTSTANPARDLLRVGAYVQVAGSNENFVKPIAATTVFVRDDRERKLSGIAVITRVVSSSPDPVYQADGYLIHVTPSTKVDFAGDLSSLNEIVPNVWIHYTGKRNSNGMLDASHVQFIPPKPTKFKAIQGIEVVPVQMRPANAPNAPAVPMASPAVGSMDGASLQEDQQLKIGLGRWHTIPAGKPVQERVHRIGMALVPGYQQQMDDFDPTKIHFRFFAVDDKNLRRAECLLDGAIVVSSQAVERLANDDQVAALLADGIACNLQRQAAREVAERRIQLAANVAAVFFPPAGLALGGRSIASGDIEERLAEERLRIALALMKDAGYDPWQAPEAWRLLSVKKLPANLASLEYPDAGCYQISVLNLQYARTPQGQ